MNKASAIIACKAGKRIAQAEKDATGNWAEWHTCWLDDEGDLVRSHPTEPVGTIAAPEDGVYYVMVYDEDYSPEAEEKAWQDSSG